MIVSSDPFFEVCVLITAFNVEKYISKALDSALDQVTNFEFGIFIFEDKSTDSTLEILLEYQARFPDKIYVVQNPENLGMMPNYLNGLESTNSKYIAILDGDDYWTDSSKLQVQYDFLEAYSDYSLCWHDATMVDSDENTIRTFSDRFSGRDYSSDFDLKQVVIWKVLGATSSLFFRNYKLKFPVWMRNLYGTEAIVFMIWRQKGKLKYLPSNFSCYRVHIGSQEASFDKISKSLRNINEEKLLFSNFTPLWRGHFSKKILWNRMYLIGYSIRIFKLNLFLKMCLGLLEDGFFLIFTPKNETITL